MAKAAMNEIWGIFFSPINMVGMARITGSKVRFMVIVWLEARQREVRGGPYAPPPPTPQIAPPGPPPNRPSRRPPSPKPLLEPPPPPFAPSRTPCAEGPPPNS